MRPHLSGASSGIFLRWGFAMSEPNTPQKTLEAWKQIAAYLDRSERTVRRWEASEGLPVHRREHERQDTVFAFRHEIDAWSRLRTKFPGEISIKEAENFPPVQTPANAYLVEHDAITRTIHRYIAAARAGDADLMRPAFHPSATISGYCQGVEYTGSVEHVFRWINENGPAPHLRAFSLMV
jgi:Putative lumazine-binding